MRHLRAEDNGAASLCGTRVAGAWTYASFARDAGELDCWLCATIAGIDLGEVDQ